MKTYQINSNQLISDNTDCIKIKIAPCQRQLIELQQLKKIEPVSNNQIFNRYSKVNREACQATNEKDNAVIISLPYNATIKSLKENLPLHFNFFKSIAPNKFIIKVNNVILSNEIEIHKVTAQLGNNDFLEFDIIGEEVDLENLDNKNRIEADDYYFDYAANTNTNDQAFSANNKNNYKNKNNINESNNANQELINFYSNFRRNISSNEINSRITNSEQNKIELVLVKCNIEGSTKKNEKYVYSRDVTIREFKIDLHNFYNFDHPKYLIMKVGNVELENKMKIGDYFKRQVVFDKNAKKPEFDDSDNDKFDSNEVILCYSTYEQSEEYKKRFIEKNFENNNSENLINDIDNHGNNNNNNNLKNKNNEKYRLDKNKGKIDNELSLRENTSKSHHKNNDSRNYKNKHYNNNNNNNANHNNRSINVNDKERYNKNKSKDNLSDRKISSSISSNTEYKKPNQRQHKPNSNHTTRTKFNNNNTNNNYRESFNSKDDIQKKIPREKILRQEIFGDLLKEINEDNKKIDEMFKEYENQEKLEKRDLDFLCQNLKFYNIENELNINDVSDNLTDNPNKLLESLTSTELRKFDLINSVNSITPYDFLSKHSNHLFDKFLNKPLIECDNEEDNTKLELTACEDFCKEYLNIQEDYMRFFDKKNNQEYQSLEELTEEYKKLQIDFQHSFEKSGLYHDIDTNIIIPFDQSNVELTDFLIKLREEKICKLEYELYNKNINEMVKPDIEQSQSQLLDQQQQQEQEQNKNLMEVDDADINSNLNNVKVDDEPKNIGFNNNTSREDITNSNNNSNNIINNDSQPNSAIQVTNNNDQLNKRVDEIDSNNKNDLTMSNTKKSNNLNLNNSIVPEKSNLNLSGKKNNISNIAISQQNNSNSNSNNNNHSKSQNKFNQEINNRNYDNSIFKNNNFNTSNSKYSLSNLNNNNINLNTNNYNNNNFNTNSSSLNSKTNLSPIDNKILNLLSNNSNTKQIGINSVSVNPVSLVITKTQPTPFMQQFDINRYNLAALDSVNLQNNLKANKHLIQSNYSNSNSNYPDNINNRSNNNNNNNNFNTINNKKNKLEFYEIDQFALKTQFESLIDLAYSDLTVEDSNKVFKTLEVIDSLSILPQKTIILVLDLDFTILEAEEDLTLTTEYINAFYKKTDFSNAEKNMDLEYPIAIPMENSSTIYSYKVHFRKALLKYIIKLKDYISCIYISTAAVKSYGDKIVRIIDNYIFKKEIVIKDIVSSNTTRDIKKLTYKCLSQFKDYVINKDLENSSLILDDSPFYWSDASKKFLLSSVKFVFAKKENSFYDVNSKKYIGYNAPNILDKSIKDKNNDIGRLFCGIMCQDKEGKLTVYPSLGDFGRITSFDKRFIVGAIQNQGFNVKNCELNLKFEFIERYKIMNKIEKETLDYSFHFLIPNYKYCNFNIENEFTEYSQSDYLYELFVKVIKVKQVKPEYSTSYILEFLRRSLFNGMCFSLDFYGYETRGYIQNIIVCHGGIIRSIHTQDSKPKFFIFDKINYSNCSAYVAQRNREIELKRSKKINNNNNNFEEENGNLTNYYLVKRINREKNELEKNNLLYELSNAELLDDNEFYNYRLNFSNFNDEKCYCLNTRWLFKSVLNLSVLELEDKCFTSL